MSWQVSSFLIPFFQPVNIIILDFHEFTFLMSQVMETGNYGDLILSQDRIECLHFWVTLGLHMPTIASLNALIDIRKLSLLPNWHEL